MTWNTDRKETLPANWADLRTAVFSRDVWLCQIRGETCTRLAAEVDHIGDRLDHSLPNLRAVCRACHSARTAQQGVGARAEIRRRGTRLPEQHPGLTKPPQAPAG